VDNHLSRLSPSHEPHQGLELRNAQEHCLCTDYCAAN
jgi:hypothetical protein